MGVRTEQAAGGAAGGAAAGAGAAAAADEEVNLTASGKAAWEGVFPSTPRAVLMKPSRTMEEVAVFWSLPGIESKTETLPGQLLGYLLGQESKGSLTAELVKRGWATGLSAVRMPSVEPPCSPPRTHTTTPDLTPRCSRYRGWMRTWRRSRSWASRSR